MKESGSKEGAFAMLHFTISHFSLLNGFPDFSSQPMCVKIFRGLIRTAPVSSRQNCGAFSLADLQSLFNLARTSSDHSIWYVAASGAIGKKASPPGYMLLDYLDRWSVMQNSKNWLFPRDPLNHRKGGFTGGQIQANLQELWLGFAWSKSLLSIALREEGLQKLL